MIDRASEEQLKNSIDIVDIISNYIELKKAGANFKANCPFHGEKTPSFVVSPSKQIFHCFGCLAGGDAIKFVQDYEKLNYPEALEKIASIMNFSLTHTKGSSDYSETRRVLEHVQEWYSKNLSSNSIVNSYLQQRGINTQSIEKFGIGYVGKSYELIKFLSDNFLPIPKAEEAGVVAKKDNSSSFYARLTERITFPIYSASNAIVGFGGRTITNHPAKYINSPQTKLFNKSQILYGYSKAKSNIYKEKKIIICEGYLDVILFHQAGFNTAVATLGTALTAEHLPLLRKGEPQIILAYDGDKAGVSAALKASIMLSEKGFDGSVVLFPNGQDPADMITTGKIQEVANLLHLGQGIIPFTIDMMAKSYDLKNPRQKEIAFTEVKGFLDKLTPIIREAYISYSATILDVPITLFGLVSKAKEKKDTNKIQLNNLPKDNLGLLNIIKTVSQNDKLLNKLLSAVEPSLFKEYSSLIETIIKGDKDEPNLVGLMLDESYKVLDDEQFKKELIHFLIISYNEKRKNILNNNNLSLVEKEYIYRKIRTDIIPRLKRGELVKFNKLELPN